MIRTFPDPILSRRCREVTPDDFEGGYIAALAGELEQAMAQLEETTGLKAMGLSAPQIGYDLRVFRVMQWPGVFVNPEIEYEVEKGQHRRPWVEDEACFSLPGVILQVARARRVRLRYLNEKGEQRSAKMRDRDARIVQHEYDHLNGVTIIQRAADGSEGLVTAGLIEAV